MIELIFYYSTANNAVTHLPPVVLQVTVAEPLVDMEVEAELLVVSHLRFSAVDLLLVLILSMLSLSSIFIDRGHIDILGQALVLVLCG